MNLRLLDHPKFKYFWLTGGFLLIGLIGAIDYLTGYEMAFSPFYLFPIFLITWLAGKRLGILASVVSAVVWLVADSLTHHTYSNPSLYLTNPMLRLFNFLVVTLLAARLRNEIERHKELAREDVITGLANIRAFQEFIDAELARASRYDKPITLLYVDLDNFKVINDQFGHQEGNRALRAAGKALRGALRRVDFVARIGGDEFAAVLPETGKYCAPMMCQRVLNQMVSEMANQHWPVTFSMGVVTAEHAAGLSADSLLRQADALMYQVKKSGKNNFCFALYQPEAQPVSEKTAA